jgi:hypothetical protein
LEGAPWCQRFGETVVGRIICSREFRGASLVYVPAGEEAEPRGPQRGVLTVISSRRPANSETTRWGAPWRSAAWPSAIGWAHDCGAGALRAGSQAERVARRPSWMDSRWVVNEVWAASEDRAQLPQAISAGPPNLERQGLGVAPRAVGGHRLVRKSVSAPAPRSRQAEAGVQATCATTIPTGPAR